MLTLAMPQSEPAAERNSSASRRSLVKIAEDRPCDDRVVDRDRLVEIVDSEGRRGSARTFPAARCPSCASASTIAGRTK